MNLQAMMKQAQAMQKDVKKKKDSINAMEFNGESSIVDIKVNGKKEVLEVNIKEKDSLESDDIEMLEDMIVVALNDAFKKVDKETKKQMGNLDGLSDFM